MTISQCLLTSHPLCRTLCSDATLFSEFMQLATKFQCHTRKNQYLPPWKAHFPSISPLYNVMKHRFQSVSLLHNDIQDVSLLFSDFKRHFQFPFLLHNDTKCHFPSVSLIMTYNITSKIYHYSTMVLNVTSSLYLYFTMT